jgi:hypothetical protein
MQLRQGVGDMTRTRHGNTFPPGVGRKQARTAIYRGEHGKVLFVPLECMWAFREAALALRNEQKHVPSRRPWQPSSTPPRHHQVDTPVSLACIAKVLSGNDVPAKKVVHKMESKVGHWRKVYGAFPWFNGWLFGDPVPPNVRVATLDEIRSCREWLDFRGHMVAAGIRSPVYNRWLANRHFIPDLGCLKWLFGLKKPLEYFVIDEKLAKLRKEKTQKRILAAAGLGRSTRQKWERDPVRRDALKVACGIAAARGNVGDISAQHPAWETLPTRTKNNIWAYAQAATLTACCERVGFFGNEYVDRIREARRMGVLADLDRFLDGAPRSSTGEAFRGGEVAPRLFQPTSDILKFRNIAAEAMAESNITKLTKIPGFSNWFLDWAVPWSHKGERIRFPGIESVRVNPESFVHWGEARRKRNLERRAKAVETLKQALNQKGGILESNEAKQLAKEAGISTRQLFSAKATLNVCSEKSKWGGLTYWCLPGRRPGAHDHQQPAETPPDEVASTADLASPRLSPTRHYPDSPIPSRKEESINGGLDPRPTKGGRPEKNATLVKRALELRITMPNKEVLKRLKQEFKGHSIFQAKEPARALRAAIYYAGHGKNRKRAKT